ncbi:TetR/AcrR family transcriptional regulator, partial [Shigella sonnei]|uniref:TetR/AcrR family transcriptional regulator n=1 Tax=Shigella sonnei TaxID=624 RepID=UPI001C12AA5B
SDRSLRKRENTRARLVEAAADIVASKGIAGTRIDDVVKGAGFTRGAFFSIYSSLEEVLTEAIVLRANTLLGTITEAIEATE